MFCARCGRDLREMQDCDQCGWSVNEIDSPLGSPAPPRSVSGTAMVSLICAVVSFFTCAGGGVIPIIGLILGIQGLKSEQPGIATAGIILNAAILVVFVLTIMLFGIMWIQSPMPSGVPAGRCC